MVNQYTHLDLLAPMPDVEVDKQRVLIVEGSLKHRDHSNTRVSACVEYYSLVRTHSRLIMGAAILYGHAI